MTFVTVDGDTSVTPTNCGSGTWGTIGNCRVADAACASISISGGGIACLYLTHDDMPFPSAPTNVLGKVEIRFKAGKNGGTENATVKIRRSGQSFCAGHALATSGTISCSAYTYSSYVECTHSQRPRTMDEAKGTVETQHITPTLSSFLAYGIDVQEVRYEYFVMGTPATPSAVKTGDSEITVTKGASPTGATHWQVYRSDDGVSGWALISAQYIPVGTTTFVDTGIIQDTKYYKIRYSANSAGDFCNFSAVDSATTAIYLLEKFPSTVINVVFPGGYPLWFNPPNVQGDVTSTYASCNVSTVSPFSDYLTGTVFPEFGHTVKGVIDVRWLIEQEYDGNALSGSGVLQTNDGTGWCVGHAVVMTATKTIVSGLCKHFVWTRAKLDVAQVRFQITAATSISSVAPQWVYRLSLRSNSALNAQTSRSARYGVIFEARVSRSVRYAVVFENRVSRSVRYSILYESRVSRSIRYSVLYTARQSRSARYTILLQNRVSRQSRYNIVFEARVSRSVRYSVFYESRVSRQSRYSVIYDSRASRSARYKVILQSRVSRSIRYNLVSDSRLSRSARYSIFYESRVSRQTRYSVFFEARVSRQARYSVFFESKVSRTARYAILLQDRVSRSLRYRTAIEARISRSIRYILRFGEAPFRVSIYGSTDKIIFIDGPITKGLDLLGSIVSPVNIIGPITNGVSIYGSTIHKLTVQFKPLS